MRLIIKSDYDSCSIWAADYIAKKINNFNPKQNNPFVLGLPTGSTPIGIYKELIKMYKNNLISFKDIVTFNMDEYIGLEKDNPQSYHYFMWENFFKYIDIQEKNINIPDGTAKDIYKECMDYENKIKQYGKIHLFLGGVGSDGHIAFNEPFSSLSSRTRIKTLTSTTRADNARFFDGNISKTPKTALTVGIGTILDAEEIIIMATGKKKSKAIQQAVEGAITHTCPITALQMHKHVIIICDKDATSSLHDNTLNYFNDIEKDNNY